MPWLILCLFSLGVVAQEAAIGDTEKDAALRLLRASLSAPDADVDTILGDAKSLFGNMLSAKVLEELVVNVTSAGPSCSNAEATTAHTEIPRKVDRHAKRVEATIDDYNCMEREFDMNDPLFDPEEAAQVLSKCRLLVVRNIWPQELMLEYKANFSNYLSNLHEGKIAKEGTTTLGEGHFYSQRNTKRFDVLLPKYLKHNDIHINRKVAKILSHPRVLGKEFIVNSIGSVIAEKGAPAGAYHYDDEYLFTDDSFEHFAVAGADLPPYAVTMFYPLLNVTEEHGATEFCMGTTHYKGLYKTGHEVVDESLIADGTEFDKLAEFEKLKKSCPKENRRTPILNLGDAIFFDYTITHRGGPNISPELRAMQYVFYSRYWYRDSNFEPAGKAFTQLPIEDQRTITTRFAVVDEIHECDEPPCPERVALESISDFLNPGAKESKFQIFNEDFKGASLNVGDLYLDELKIGESVSLELAIGTKVYLYNEQDEKVKSWKIKSKQKRIVLRSEDLTKTE